tara:strand:- start:453 stop:836 length:384 start_codon:yes stop_codon:yes gene_type:complete
MKISKQKLKELIKEELKLVLNESWAGNDGTGPRDRDEYGEEIIPGASGTDVGDTTESQKAVVSLISNGVKKPKILAYLQRKFPDLDPEAAFQRGLAYAQRKKMNVNSWLEENLEKIIKEELAEITSR